MVDETKEKRRRERRGDLVATGTVATALTLAVCLTGDQTPLQTLAAACGIAGIWVLVWLQAVVTHLLNEEENKRL